MLHRLKNKLIARAASLFPFMADKLTAAYTPWESEDIPWTPIKKPPAESTIALVTTAGVHHRHQHPFDMADPLGDPTFRILERDKISADYTITHDYYDHRNADKDLNIVLPLDRLKEMCAAGVIGAVADKHYSFMGHIDGRHIATLIQNQGPAAAAMLAADGVDAVVLTPG